MRPLFKCPKCGSTSLTTDENIDVCMTCGVTGLAAHGEFRKPVEAVGIAVADAVKTKDGLR